MNVQYFEDMILISVS